MNSADAEAQIQMRSLYLAASSGVNWPPYRCCQARSKQACAYTSAMSMVQRERRAGRWKSGRWMRMLPRCAARCAALSPVSDLEILIESELAQTLQPISDEGRRPSLGESRQTRTESEVRDLTGVDGADACDGAGELLGVGLRIALHQIQRGHQTVRHTARNNAAETACGEVGGGVKLDLTNTDGGSGKRRERTERRAETRAARWQQSQ